MLKVSTYIKAKYTEKKKKSHTSVNTAKPFQLPVCVN